MTGSVSHMDGKFMRISCSTCLLKDLSIFASRIDPQIVEEIEQKLRYSMRGTHYSFLRPIATFYIKRHEMSCT